ncbi:chondroitin sulfate proteoglycan 4-like [Pontoporia blainvillei]|uniref:Chondroitin sulfate proteoglycan 4-like n=1 Tax=Pontoporia blainvillei TaxID=48723 RepID=A0ABX0S0V9_PONBL|nr:chondroitin sulfate proteoglycan 4-like [Pontoporia blainvillei]
MARESAVVGAAVKEGDKVLIGQSKSDASNLFFKLPKPQCSSYETWFQVTSLPHHGTIMVGERNITKSKPDFSQYVINKLGITYLHDDSESLADNFTFAIWPNQKSKSTAKPEADFLEEMFNITITPINDQALELRTQGLQLKVLQVNRLVLGPENLKVEDPDSPPSDIRSSVNLIMAFWQWLTMHTYLFSISHKPTLITLRLLFSPNPILTVLCGNRFHSLQNKQKHSLCGTRDNYPGLRSLDVMPQTTVATIPGHGQLLLKKTSLLLFQK